MQKKGKDKKISPQRSTKREGGWEQQEPLGERGGKKNGHLNIIAGTGKKKMEIPGG